MYRVAMKTIHSYYPTRLKEHWLLINNLIMIMVLENSRYRFKHRYGGHLQLQIKHSLIMMMMIFFFTSRIMEHQIVLVQ